MVLTKMADLRTYGLVVSLVLLVCLAAGQIMTTTPTPQYAAVLAELSAVTQGRAALEHQIQQHRNSFTNLRKQEQAAKDSCTCYNKSGVAFTAFLGRDVTTYGERQPLPFSSVTLNQGNAYDTRYAAFTAPVNGTYQFFVTVSTNAGYTVVVDILHNTTPLVKIRTGNLNQFNTATNGVTVHMTAGDDVWVEHDRSITDSNRLFLNSGLTTSFTGYIISKD